VNCFHASAKGIDNPIFFSFNVFDFEIIFTKEGHPSSLSGIELRLVKQISQSTVICHNYKFPSQEVMPPHFQGMHYGSPFYIMGHIVDFMFIQFSKFIADHTSFLHKDSSEPFLRGICAHKEVSFWVNDFQHVCMGQYMFQGLKSLFTFVCP
jgi:hypothetical protein